MATLLAIVSELASASDTVDRDGIVAALEGVSAPIHVALNKVDLRKVRAIEAWAGWIEEHLPDARIHRVSAKHGKGEKALLAAITAETPRMFSKGG